MGATNHTSEIQLPLFVDDDKPSWLGDVNNAHQKIDAAIVVDRAQMATMQAQILALQTQVADLIAGGV